MLQALRVAALDIGAALEPFSCPSPETSRLLALLQAVRPRPQGEIHAELLAAQDLAERIVRAVPETHGRQPQQALREWVCFAADAWVKFTDSRPTAGDGRAVDSSPFLSALEEFSAEQATPRVTRAILREVLPDWERLRN